LRAIAGSAAQMQIMYGVRGERWLDERELPWLSGYEHACRDRATCRLVGHVGRPDTHRRIAPIIELHDGATKALESLPLA